MRRGLPLLLVLVLAACGGGDGGGETTAEVDPQLHVQLRDAVRRNDVAEARRLLEQGASPNERDAAGETALLLAAGGEESGAELIEVLVEHGANPRAVDEQGDTPLIRAARGGAHGLVRPLVEAESPVDHVNYLGWTALLAAVVLGDGSEPYQQTVRTLLEAGADPNIGDANGIAPLVHATAAGQAEVARILREGGAG